MRLADVAELVDALALGASAVRHRGSSPFIRTMYLKIKQAKWFIMIDFSIIFWKVKYFY